MNYQSGVIQTNNAEWLWEEIFDNGIDLTWQEHVNECAEYAKNDFCSCLDGVDGHTYIIGFELNDKTGKYEIDKSAEFSAIMGEVYTQVVHSQYILDCAMCSPCYSNQGDLDTPGDFPTYAIPPEYFGEFDWYPTDLIRKIKNAAIGAASK